MAKRFVDTNKYKKPFLRGLPGSYKLLWDFLCLDCDHAGIWIVDFEIAQTYIGADMPVTKQHALTLFNQDEDRIIEIDGGKKWFVPSFIEFQYGKLSEKNRAHISVISILKKHNLLNPDLSIKNHKALTSPLQGVKDKDMDKELEKDMDFGKSENLLEPVGVIPDMCLMFTMKNDAYPMDQFTDFPAVRSIAQKILKWEGGKGDITLPANTNTICRRWGDIVNFIRADDHYSGYSLSRINKHLQSIIQSFNSQRNGTHKQPPPGNNRQQGANQLLDSLRKDLESSAGGSYNP